MELEQQTKTTPLFTLNGFKTDAKIVYVYDGDTVHIVFKYFNEYYKWNCRIAHVDTPELRTKNQDEKIKGYETRDKLKELILDKIVKVHCLEFDKYGRLLVDLYIDDIYVNQWLIDNDLAKKYEGGTKEKW